MRRWARERVTWDKRMIPIGNVAAATRARKLPPSSKKLTDCIGRECAAITAGKLRRACKPKSPQVRLIPNEKSSETDFSARRATTANGTWYKIGMENRKAHAIIKRPVVSMIRGMECFLDNNTTASTGKIARSKSCKAHARPMDKVP